MLQGPYDCARLLIQRGADVNYTQKGGSILQLTARLGRIDICRLLLDNKADIDNNIDIYVPSEDRQDCRPMILDEIENRHKRALFDSFINHHIDYRLYKHMIYSICYPDGNTQVAAPRIGWPRAETVLNKYYYDETFFHLHRYVAKIITKCTSNHYSSIIDHAINSDDTSTLMTVLVDRLVSYLKPPAL